MGKKAWLDLSITADYVEAKATNIERAASFETVLAYHGNGDETDWHVNPAYLKTALEQIGDGAQILFNGWMQPCLLMSKAGSKHDRRAVVSEITPK